MWIDCGEPSGQSRVGSAGRPLYHCEHLLIFYHPPSLSLQIIRTCSVAKKVNEAQRYDIKLRHPGIHFAYYEFTLDEQFKGMAYSHFNEFGLKLQAELLFQQRPVMTVNPFDLAL